MHVLTKRGLGCGDGSKIDYMTLRQFWGMTFVCLAATATAAGRDADLVAKKAFGSSTNFEVVMEAEKVLVCRLTPQGNDGGFRKPSGYREGEKFEVPPKLIAKLREELSDSESYVHRTAPRSGGAHGCITTYGVRFFFTKGASTLEVNLCLVCRVIGISRDGKIFKETPYKRDTDFTNLCKELFPEDQEIQRLK